MVVLCLVATSCESGGTLNVVVRWDDIFALTIVTQHVSKVDCTKVCKVHLEYWHVTVAMVMFHDLLMSPTIDQANVVPSVVVVHNEKTFFQLKGAWACRYQHLMWFC
jgi:hypothetical protein